MSGDTQVEVAFLQLWGEANNCTLDLEGEIGFGRPCVGFTHEGQGHRSHFVSYGWDDREACPPAEVTTGYDKDACLAVLVKWNDDEENPGPDESDRPRAIHELYLWCRMLHEKGYRVKVQSRDFGQYEAAGSYFDLLLHGTTQPILVRGLHAPGVGTEAVND